VTEPTSVSHRRPAPDDEKANSPVLYVVFGLASVGLIVLAIVLLFFPPAIAAGLVIRGARSAQPILRFVGYGLLAGWFVAIVLLGRRVMSAPERLPPDER
jgi:hypothetical protein